MANIIDWLGDGVEAYREPLLSINDLMGHKTLQMVMRYAHMVPDNRHEAISLLNPKEGGAVKKRGLV